MKNPEFTDTQLRNSWEKFNETDTKDLRTSSVNWARRYSQEENCNKKARLFISLLLINENGPLLDIGSSLFAETYLPYDKSLVSLDWTYRGLSDKGKNIMGDAVRLPFTYNSFPVVLSKQLYGYLSQPDYLLAEMVRVLRPNGLFILIEHEGEITQDDKGQAPSKLCDFVPGKVAGQLVNMGINQPQITQIYTLNDYNISLGTRKDLSLTAIVGRKEL